LAIWNAIGNSAHSSSCGFSLTTCKDRHDGAFIKRNKCSAPLELALVRGFFVFRVRQLSLSLPFNRQAGAEKL
jgi:hypothetical protein